MSSSSDAFVQYLVNNRSVVAACLRDHVPNPVFNESVVDDLNRYLYVPVEQFVMTGGKWVRPALCLLGAEAVGAPSRRAYSVAAAIELFQAAALMHDDIADESEMRRGQPCMYLSEGVGIAINAGDSALVAVTSCIMDDETYDAQTKLRLLDEIIRMERLTLEGQALDLGWARDERWDISPEDYLAMARRKTAYYSAATPLVVGAICGGGSQEQIEGLRSFGLDCGLAFQIQDDLLNLVGDSDAQGKDYRSDITEGKRTLVMTWALAHLDVAQREELVRILGAHAVDVGSLDRAVALAQESGAIEHARRYARTLVERAKAALDDVAVAEDAKVMLRSMADFFVDRTH